MGTKSRQPHQLPPGRHGLSADFVANNQRERIIAAVALVVAGTGYADATVAAIIRRAGVSRRSFYQHFANKHDVFLAAFDQAVGALTDQAIAAYTAQEDYLVGLRCCLETCLRLLAGDPAMARMVVVEVFSAGQQALERRRLVLARLTEEIVRSARELPQPPMGAHLTAENIVGAVFQVIYNRVHQGQARELPDLLPDLLYCVLVPLVGHEVAVTERAALVEE